MSESSLKKSALKKAGAVVGALAGKQVLAKTVNRRQASREKKLMKRGTQAAAVVTVAMTAETLRRKALSKTSAMASKTKALSKGAAAADADHAIAVTVNCTPDRLRPLPEPLAALEDQVEVTVHEAPGGRGTEITARPVKAPPSGLGGVIARVAGTDRRQDVRLALRQARSLVETGEVLRPDTPPTTRSTLLGKPLELAIRRSHGEGRL